MTFFIDCGPIYVPKGTFWGSTSRPNITGDLVMSLFLLWGPPFMTENDPKMVHFGPKVANLVQKGLKGTKMVNPSVFDHL